MELGKKVCRTCLGEGVALSDLGGKDGKPGDGNQGREMLEFLLGRDLEGSEDFSRICEPCLRKLSECYSFKHQCLRSEDKIRDLIENSPVELPPKPRKKPPDGKKLRRCLRCKISFTCTTSYHLHYREKHRKTTICEQCGKSFPQKQLWRHQITHQSLRKFSCATCGSGFTLKQNLDTHMRIHTREKKYTCQYCDEKFLHWSSRRSHIRSRHTDEMFYECSICGQGFAHNSNFLRHKRLHTGDLRHECSVCQRRFSASTELRSHLVTHTGEKNEICGVCGKGFGTRKCLKTHMKIHTGERNYVCDVCEKSFTQCHVLRSHIKAAHPEHPQPPPGVVLSRKARREKDYLAQKGGRIREIKDLGTL